MVHIKFKGRKKDLIELRDKLCVALNGSPGYMGLEIVVSNPIPLEEEPNMGWYELPFVIGDDNGSDIEFLINWTGKTEIRIFDNTHKEECTDNEDD